MSRQCVFSFPGLPGTLDILATLHLVQGIKEVLVPEDFLDDPAFQSVEPKRDLPFVSFVEKKVMDRGLLRAESSLKAIGLDEKLCAHYPEKHYLTLLNFFRNWHVAKELNAQIGMLTQIGIFDAVNVIAYEYAAILPLEVSREIVAWIYANTAAKRGAAEFFEVKYSDQDLHRFLRENIAPRIAQYRNQLASGNSASSKQDALDKLQRVLKDTANRIKSDWPDAIGTTFNALIAIFVNPLSWISTAIGGTKLTKKIIQDTQARVNPIFSLERTYYVDNLIPPLNCLGEDFSTFWKEARSGRLLSSPSN